MIRFYKDKPVFLTGHTGFKGSWLSILLQDLGARVTGYARDYLTPKDNFPLAGLGERMRDVRGELMDFERLEESLQRSEAEVVFHLAAQPLVRYSYENPRETYLSNVLGTLNLLEAVRRTDSVKSVVIVTSDKCYENKEWPWGYREVDRLGGHDPYSASKACTEILTASYRKSFFDRRQGHHRAAVATVRAGNVIGGGDWSPDRIVPDCMRQLEAGEPILIRNPDAIRPWQHVVEPLMGYLLLAARLYEDPDTYADAFNFGPDSHSVIPVREVVDKIIKHFGRGAWRKSEKKDNPHEAKLLRLDTAKAKHMLGWCPVWSVDEAVEKTVVWYKNYQTEDVFDLCLRQIHEFMDVCPYWV